MSKKKELGHLTLSHLNLRRSNKLVGCDGPHVRVPRIPRILSPCEKAASPRRSLPPQAAGARVRWQTREDERRRRLRRELECEARRKRRLLPPRPVAKNPCAHVRSPDKKRKIAVCVFKNSELFEVSKDRRSRWCIKDCFSFSFVGN